MFIFRLRFKEISKEKSLPTHDNFSIFDKGCLPNKDCSSSTMRKKEKNEFWISHWGSLLILFPLKKIKVPTALLK